MTTRRAPRTARAARLSGLAALCFVLTHFAAAAQEPQRRPLSELLAVRQRALSAPLSPEREAERLAHLGAAREALAAGDTAAAALRLELAANMSHAADTELLQLQVQLQRGEFRQALGFAAHTAGSHLGNTEALALYIWLLALCEQPALGRSLLDAALLREPDNERLRALSADLDRWQDPAAPRLTQPPPGPIASGPQPPAGARLLSGGLLLPDGQTALVPVATLVGSEVIWVRNGLGQTRRASRWAGMVGSAALDTQGLALLRLEAALPLTAPPLTRAARDAFAGSPAAALAPMQASNAAAAWPQLHSGFVGRVGMRGQALGFDLPHALPGGPVLDGAGRLIGLARRSGDQALQLLPLSSLMATEGAPLAALPVSPGGARLSPDQLYEAALPYTLQVLAE